MEKRSWVEMQRFNIDIHSLRQSEIEALSGSSEFSEFYERLRVIKDHHRKYPNEPVEPPEMEFIHAQQADDEYQDDGGYYKMGEGRNERVTLNMGNGYRVGKVILWRRDFWKISRHERIAWAIYQLEGCQKDGLSSVPEQIR